MKKLLLLLVMMLLPMLASAHDIEAANVVTVDFNFLQDFFLLSKSFIIFAA